MIDKDFWSQPQLTLEPRIQGASHHSDCRAFGQSSRKRTPKIVVMSHTVTTKNRTQKEVIWQQYRLCLAVAECQILGGKHFLIFGTRIRKDLVVKKGPISSEKKYHCQWTLLLGEKPQWNHSSGIFIILSISSVHLSQYQPRVSECSFSSWRLYIQGKSDFNSSATVSAMCADQ